MIFDAHSQLTIIAKFDKTANQRVGSFTTMHGLADFCLEQKRLFISDSRRFQITHKHEDSEETTEPRADVESSCGSDEYVRYVSTSDHRLSQQVSFVR
jgi:hypothetical protein